MSAADFHSANRPPVWSVVPVAEVPAVAPGTVAMSGRLTWRGTGKYWRGTGKYWRGTGRYWRSTGK